MFPLKLGEKIAPNTSVFPGVITLGYVGSVGPAAKSPLNITPLIVRFVSPVFFIVKIFSLLLEPTLVFGKRHEEGSTLITLTAGAVPAPDTNIVSGALIALLTIVAYTPEGI